MRLDRKYNDLTDRNQFYRRSDHWNFGRLGVPFVFFFTGVHEDYHQPTDTVDKIDFSKYSHIVQFNYTSTIKAANTNERPVMDNDLFINITRSLQRRITVDFNHRLLFFLNVNLPGPTGGSNTI